MSYTYITFSQAQSQLATRLGDVSEIFWTNTEIGLWIQEAIRTFGLCSGFWRERGTIATSPSLAFYELNQNLSNGASLILQPTVTDRDIIQQVQFCLLESTSSQASWTGTEQFNYNDIVNAVKNRTNQFLSDTGVTQARSLVAVASPPIGRQPLPDTIIDVRRLAWLGAAPENYYTTVWRTDERDLTAYSKYWSVNSGNPEAYSIMGPPPLQVQLAPPPVSSGQLEMLSVNSIDISPSSSATTLTIPDDLSPAVKWGALADLLGIDGIARDLPRATYCEQRYRQYVQLARMLPVVVHGELNGVPLIPATLQELESSTPYWENSADQPTDIAIAATNIVALNPVPNAIYSVTLDVVRKAPVPLAGGDFIQVGREQMDMIIDYAEHLALFKVGGAEWHATERQAANFIMQSLMYNQRISAAARTAFAASEQSERQKQALPRRLNTSVGTGALVQNG